MTSSCGNGSQNLRDTSNELLNTHKIPIDSKCNDGYSGSCGKVLAKHCKITLRCIFYCVSLISDIASCIFSTEHYTWELNYCHNTCLWLVPRHFQQIKISHSSVSIVLSRYSIIVAGSVTNENQEHLDKVIYLTCQFHFTWQIGQKLKYFCDALFCFVLFFNTLRPRQNGRHFPDAILK